MRVRARSNPIGASGTWHEPGSKRIRQLTQKALVKALMSLTMPKPKGDVLARRETIARDLRAIVPGEGVVDNADALRVFESDGLTAYRQAPMLAVLPETV